MRGLVASCTLLASLVFASCVTYGDVPVTGRSLDVTHADIQAALAADMKPLVKPVEIEVISRDEIHLYFTRRFSNTPANHHVIKRKGGKWRYHTDVLMTE